MNSNVRLLGMCNMVKGTRRDLLWTIASRPPLETTISESLVLPCIGQGSILLLVLILNSKKTNS